MSLQSPLEGLLRPPVEWYSSLVCLFGAAILHANLPAEFDWLILPDNFSSKISCLILLLGFWRANEGYKIWRYQRNLKRMPKYVISTQELPLSDKQLFLGIGFLWKPIHT